MASKSKLRSIVLFGFLGAALIAMVVTGFGTDGMGGMGSVGGQRVQTLVEIDGEDLTDAEVRRRMSFAFSQASRQNPGLDRDQFYRANFNEMLDGLVDSRTILAFARRVGFVIPQSLVDREIVTNPAFLNVAGQYDDASFRQILQAQGMTEAQYRDDIASSLLIRMVTGPIGGGGRLPDAITRQYANLLLETRVGQLGPIPTQLLAAGIQPSDQEVAAFYQANQRQFLLPERRVLRFALIGREQLGDAVRATDAEIAAYYQEQQAQYGPSETRSVQIFTAQDEAAARRFADSVRGGANFLQAAQGAGFAAEDVNFPNQRREQLAGATSQEVADAAFGAQQGGLIGPTRTPTGFKVVRVDSIARTGGRPLETVRGEIVTTIEQRKLTEALTTRIEQIEDRVRDGASFEEVAREAGLQVQTSPAMTETGAAPGFQFPQPLSPLLSEAFQLEPNEDPVVATVQPDQVFALVQVGNVVAPAAPPLDQIRDEVRNRLIRQTAVERGRAIAEGIANKINGGMAAAQAYAQAGLTLPPRETVTARRFQIARAGQQVPPPLSILFAIPEGRARAIRAPDGAGWIVVHHERRTAGNVDSDAQGREVLDTMRTQLAETIGPEVQIQFARAIRALVNVERDEDAINALREALLAGR